MNNDSLLAILILLLVLGLLLLAWLPKHRAARAERERLAEEERKRLRAQRDSYLTTIRSGAPWFIQDARREFERDYRARKGDITVPNEMSPLHCFGYRVGKTKGRLEGERQDILRYTLAADLDSELRFLPAAYRSEWGSPLSVQRYNRIRQHLINLAELHTGKPSFGVAISHWRSDAVWFEAHELQTVRKLDTLSQRRIA